MNTVHVALCSCSSWLACWSGDDLGGVRFYDTELAAWIGNAALAIILLEGAISTRVAAFQARVRMRVVSARAPQQGGLLALFLLLAQVPDSYRFFNVAFAVVLLNGAAACSCRKGFRSGPPSPRPCCCAHPAPD